MEAAKPPRLGLLVVVMVPRSGLRLATQEAMRTPGLSDPSGSDLRVVSHDGTW